MRRKSSSAPRSIDLVRAKLVGQRLDRAAFDAILADVVQHRYSKVELSMFGMACALKTLELDELVAYTEADDRRWHTARFRSRSRRRQTLCRWEPGESYHAGDHQDGSPQ